VWLVGIRIFCCTETEIVSGPAVQNDGQVMTVANFITYHFGATATDMCMSGTHRKILALHALR
jgi:hypothetical protein